MTTVAVVPGAGMVRVYESLGVGKIVAGGQTMNPSIQDILQAIDAVKTDQVIVLPNNKNIIPAAEQAQLLAKKQVAIIPTKTIPQGIAALLAFNFQGDLDTNVKAMTCAAQKIRTIEITKATRSVKLDNLQVKEGQFIGLIDDELTGAGDDRTELALDMLKHAHTEEYEIVTIYYGDTVNANESADLSEAIRKQYPSQEVEVVSGGQPHYHFIISVE
jgi:dihydroxyacetone kinase-like predicted kinase